MSDDAEGERGGEGEGEGEGEGTFENKPNSDGNRLDPEFELDPEDTPLPNCLRCNRPVARTTMIDPTDAVAGPCSCRVAPGFSTRSQSDTRDE
ncbi:hypothetical protein [Natrialba chahannaoensis]|nr:hypothetical protein [Natrialba chahannaoensis]